MRLPLLQESFAADTVVSKVKRKIGGKDDWGKELESMEKEKGTTWVSSMMIIIANVMGIGVLGLADAFARLGWL